MTKQQQHFIIKFLTWGIIIEAAVLAVMLIELVEACR